MLTYAAQVRYEAAVAFRILTASETVTSGVEAQALQRAVPQVCERGGAAGCVFGGGGLYTYTYMHTCVYMYTYRYVYIHTYTYVHTYRHVYAEAARCPAGADVS
jgi:hypothetical protein